MLYSEWLVVTGTLGPMPHRHPILNQFQGSLQNRVKASLHNSLQELRRFWVKPLSDYSCRKLAQSVQGFHLSIRIHGPFISGFHSVHRL